MNDAEYNPSRADWCRPTTELLRSAGTIHAAANATVMAVYTALAQILEARRLARWRRRRTHTACAGSDAYHERGSTLNEQLGDLRSNDRPRQSNKLNERAGARLALPTPIHQGVSCVYGCF